MINILNQFSLVLFSAILLFFLCIIIVFVILLFIRFQEKINKESDILQVSDSIFIVRDEVVNFDEDTSLNRYKQQREDDRHYRFYVNRRTALDRKSIWLDYIRTLDALEKFPDLKQCVTSTKLESITDEYNKYVIMCKVLNEDSYSTKEEFLIRKENPQYCKELFPLYLDNPITYDIYHEETAKYKGNTIDLIKDQFKKEWY